MEREPEYWTNRHDWWFIAAMAALCLFILWVRS